MILSLFLINAPIGLHCTCPKHLCKFSLTLFSTRATYNCHRCTHFLSITSMFYHSSISTFLLIFLTAEHSQSISLISPRTFPVEPFNFHQMSLMELIYLWSTYPLGQGHVITIYPTSCLCGLTYSIGYGSYAFK